MYNKLKLTEIMKKILVIALSLLFSASFMDLQAQMLDKQGVIDSLTTLDKSIIKYFPRWKICESEKDLLVQIYQTFVYKKFAEEDLNMNDITILAAPRSTVEDPYEVLLITCGRASMNAVQIESFLTDYIKGIISGEYFYKSAKTDDIRGTGEGKIKKDPDYCVRELPIDVPLTDKETSTIIDFLQPNNARHAFTLSLFEQTLKIGSTGFWIRNTLGNDEVGYPFWNSGQAKVTLQRPLIINEDPGTQTAIPSILDAYLGAGYRHTSGLDNDGSLFGWVKDRYLNCGPGGKLVFGLDFALPSHPQFGIDFDLDIPMQDFKTEGIDEAKYSYLPVDRERELEFSGESIYNGNEINKTAYALRATGQISVVYHWWVDKKIPDNYFRFNLGVSYSEVQEYAFVKGETIGDVLTQENVLGGLGNYKPNEFADWLYIKAEYRNQMTFPFGASIQISNQIFLGRVYIPLFNNWLYLEGKFATPIRDARPYEMNNFFMISPVIRLTI